MRYPFLSRFFESVPATTDDVTTALGTQTMTRTHGEGPDSDPRITLFSGTQASGLWDVEIL